MPSSDLKLGKRRRTYVRLMGEIYDALHEALQEENERRGLTITAMADCLDTDKSFISRKMNGSSNMTMETFADLAYSLDRVVKVKLISRSPERGTNISHQLESRETPEPSGQFNLILKDASATPNSRATTTASKTTVRILETVG
jgi:hypothetical protein